MTLTELFADSSMRAKAMAKEVGASLTDGHLQAAELLAFAKLQDAVPKATCIEGLEFATRERPDLVDGHMLDFLVESLKDDAPRVKWESARVIGNVAARFSDDLGPAIEGLMRNAMHTGTVVRWSSAFALGEILIADAGRTPSLLRDIEELSEGEENSGVQKKYLAAIEKIGERRP